ncbi:hypothetical protein AX16_001837 [Volvariella volvacea WC 439]|nr:hypothetical protein AX16_001837 [Volvariella volvacea WC 439]
MFLAGMFLTAFARSLASPVPTVIPSSPIPSPLCVVTAALSTGVCDPNRKRTIFDILYSCLGVIFLCTYISIHHNIPDQNDSWGKKTWLKVRTMVYAMLAPELVIMWALRQRLMADKLAVRYKSLRWTRTHGFFLQMGGLMMEVESGRYEVVRWRAFNDRLETSSEIAIDKPPTIKKREIEDRGKGDVLSKAIVILQTSWFVVQCIARRVEGLYLTELELVTLAFAALNTMTYILWWDKPLNVGYPIYFDEEGNRVDGPEDREEEAWYEALWRWMTRNQGSRSEQEGVSLLRDHQGSPWGYGAAWRKVVKTPFRVIFGSLMDMTNEEGDKRRLTSVHPFYAAQLGDGQHRLAYLYGSVIGVFFGGIHLIGWNFTFSTTTELWLWRSSSLVLTVIPAIITLSWPLGVNWWNVENYHPFIDRVLWFVLARIGTPLYIAARIIIILLAFFSLRDLPDSAYQNVKWTNFIPHI